MKVFGLATILALAMTSLAQNNGTVVKVAVGGVLSQNQNIYMFSPFSVTAKTGDVVQFEFSGNIGNHSITQSSFASPCQEIQGGFDSGWVFVPNGFGGPFATWNLTITSTDPIWFYCKQTLPQFHCASGMVGAINAPTSGDNTFDNYLGNAKKATGQTPGQAAGGLVGQGASASAVPGPITGDLKYFGTPTSGMASSTGSGGSSTPGSTTGSNSNGAVVLDTSRALVLFATVVGMLFA